MPITIEIVLPVYSDGSWKSYIPSLYFKVSFEKLREFSNLITNPKRNKP